MIKKCERCNKERLIYAKCLCNSCYVYLHTDKEKHKRSKIKWMKNNKDKINESRRDYMREYMRKRNNIQSKNYINCGKMVNNRELARKIAEKHYAEPNRDEMVDMIEEGIKEAKKEVFDDIFNIPDEEYLWGELRKLKKKHLT